MNQPFANGPAESENCMVCGKAAGQCWCAPPPQAPPQSASDVYEPFTTPATGYGQQGQYSAFAAPASPFEQPYQQPQQGAPPGYPGQQPGQPQYQGHPQYQQAQPVSASPYAQQPPQQQQSPQQPPQQQQYQQQQQQQYQQQQPQHHPGQTGQVPLSAQQQTGQQRQGGQQSGIYAGYAQPASADAGLVLSNLRGQVFARKYQLIELLGEGSIGASYLAEHVILRKRVTVKLFRRTFINNENAYRHLMTEASSAANISHPYLVSLFDFGVSDDGIPYAVMEFVDGTDIKTAIDAEGPMKPARVVRLARLICDALGHAHENGVIHRDLNSTNILLLYGADGMEMVKIVDFGIAKAGASGELEILEQQGEVLGNPAYTSPEQATGGSIDIRSDIYSFGCVLFEMLTGKTPFPGQTAQDTLNSQVMQKPKKISEIRPELKSYPELSDVIERCLSKDPESRYVSMFQLRDEIGLLSTKLEKKKRGKGNLKLILVAVAGVLLLLVSGAAMFFVGKAVGGGTESSAPPRPAAVSGEATKGPSIAVAEIGRLLGRAKTLENADNAEGAIRSYENALKLCSDSSVPLDLKFSVAYPLMVLYRKQEMEKPATRLYTDVQSVVSAAADRSTEGVDATLGAEVVYQYGMLQGSLADAQANADDADTHRAEAQKALRMVANVLEKSESDSPLLGGLYQRLGELYLSSGDNKDALWSLENALRTQTAAKKPVQGKTKALLAKSYNALGEYQKASVEAQMAIELLGNSDVKLSSEMEAMRKQIAAMPPKPATTPDTAGGEASSAASAKEADGKDARGDGSTGKGAGSDDAEVAERPARGAEKSETSAEKPAKAADKGAKESSAKSKPSSGSKSKAREEDDDW